MNDIYLISKDKDVKGKNIISFSELEKFKSVKGLYFKFIDICDEVDTFNFDYLNSIIQDSKFKAIRIFGETKNENIDKFTPSYRLDYYHYNPYSMLFNYELAMKIKNSIEKNNLFEYFKVISLKEDIPCIYKTVYSCNADNSRFFEGNSQELNEYIHGVENLISFWSSNQFEKRSIQAYFSILVFEMFIIDYKQNANIKKTFKIYKKMKKKLKKIKDLEIDEFKYHNVKTRVIREITTRNWKKVL